jgi:hypothetical protein
MTIINDIIAAFGITIASIMLVMTFLLYFPSQKLKMDLEY